MNNVPDVDEMEDCSIKQVSREQVHSTSISAFKRNINSLHVACKQLVVLIL